MGADKSTVRLWRQGCNGDGVAEILRLVRVMRERGDAGESGKWR